MDAETVVGEIKYKLSVTDLPLGTIANELEFSSLDTSPDFAKDVWDVLPES